MNGTGREQHGHAAGVANNSPVGCCLVRGFQRPGMSTKKAPPAGAPFVLPQLGDTGQEQCKSEPFVKNKGRVSSWRWYPAFFASGMVFRLMVWYTRLNKSEFVEYLYYRITDYKTDELQGRRFEKNMSKEIKWAVLGTGVIANEMAAGLQKMGKSLYAVGNRTYDKAVAFAEKYGIEKVYPSIDEMFADEDVDIIYITTPHNTHYGFMKKALENGKHILVEKSITLNSSELCEMISLANERGLILAEAMTIWHMPIYKELWKIIENGELGKVQMITVNFGSFKDYDMKNRFFNRKLAGGAMLDIGVYALSIVRSFMEEKPENLMSQWKSAPTGVDEQATILLQNDKDQMATVALTMHSKQPKRVMISCEKGYIEIMEFPRADKAIITEALTGEKREISAGNTADALYYELTDMETAINSGDASVMKLQYSIDVMDIMTRLRNEWGLKYPEEE